MWVRLDLAPQRRYASIDTARRDQNGISPHRVHDAFSRQSAPGTLQKKLEEPELFAR